MFLKCKDCNGKGYVLQKQLYNNIWTVKITCPTCRGKGKVPIITKLKIGNGYKSDAF